MKIYNKKSFWAGLGELLLGVACLVTLIWKGFDLKLALLGLAVALFGAAELRNSFSRAAARRAKTEALDERNLLVDLRARAAAFRLAFWILFLATVAGMVAYGVTGRPELAYLVLGTGTPLALIQIGHIAAQIYYEARC